MHCWTTATTMPIIKDGEYIEDSTLKVLYSGTDENEAVRVARAAAKLNIYAKVLAKDLGGFTLYRALHPSFEKPMREFREAAATLPPDHPIRKAIAEVD
ncbi:MAG: hypothetical protein ACREXS_10965 [Gammaproteobacteria bacterium]